MKIAWSKNIENDKRATNSEKGNRKPFVHMTLKAEPAENV